MAFSLDHATNITVRNSSVRWGDNRPEYYAHALESHAITDLSILNPIGKSVFPKKLVAIK
ncbi:hypothetical protein [uncultured Hymenobacter sp.]|uniref:hypothetical protein n=1 Tax=uncultured Hymenobacter sp. TaxID=170016 RepID=UPI0035CBA1DF